MDSDNGITPKAIYNKMRCLVNEILGPDGTDNLDESYTEDNSGTENAATATTNVAQSRKVEINNASRYFSCCRELVGLCQHNPS